MSNNLKMISNALSLRLPQRESLNIFEKICDVLSFDKEKRNMPEELTRVTNILTNNGTTGSPFKDFERTFPSFCFALATGIGKTRLMGAMIAWLHYEKGVNNFLVIAPNLTIYNKLKNDLGDIGSPKYVFKGLDKFVSPPDIIDGDNYGNKPINIDSIFSNDYNKVRINVFNISKFNADSKEEGGQTARIKRLKEQLGGSYFEYLKSLPNLCIFMDESHHYHADRSFSVINELAPLLGVELTATPQIQKGTRSIPFKNIVYEYSLASALNDEKYVKVPTVFTRKDFKPEQFTEEALDKEKLIDGIKLHIDTQAALDLYARNNGKKQVRPFVLVVAKDTEHSRRIMDFITSSEFFNGRYKDKVMEINSTLRGNEKDENIERLLTLEKPDNKIEIVIHVNMLKEGWDVTNLYTIIPLRASASDTLTEQTIGRGLRLPYGERTGDEKVDRLSIVSHDKYEAIIKLAQESGSIVRRVSFIEDCEDYGGEPTETLELPSALDEALHAPSFSEQLIPYIPQIPEMEPDFSSRVASTIANHALSAVQDLNKHTVNINEVNKPEILKIAIDHVVRTTMETFPMLDAQDVRKCAEKAATMIAQELTDKVIPIPRMVVQAINEVKLVYRKFRLDASGINFQPSIDEMRGTELRDKGKTFDVDLRNIGDPRKFKAPEDGIIALLILKDNVAYEKCSDIIYDLISQLKNHLHSYLSEEDTGRVLIERRKALADIIHAQMNQHFEVQDLSYQAHSVHPFSRLEVANGTKIIADEIYEYTDEIASAALRGKIFKGFRKSCHTMYKFDSATEKDFAIVLENDSEVLKWLRPAMKQFNIYYDRDSNARYEPDFVVETENAIYMVETKARKDLDDKEVTAKKKAAEQYCAAATDYNLKNGGKRWIYAVIPHDEVRKNSSFKNLVTAGESISSQGSLGI